MKTVALRPFLTAKLALLIFGTLLLLSSCDLGIRGSGHLTTENRPVADFTTVEANGALDLEWSRGAPALAVTTDDNLQRHIETRVDGQKLIVTSRGTMRPTDKVRVRLTSSGLTAAALRGAVALRASNINAPEFFLDATGATSTTLDGTAGALTASMSGASRLHAEKFQTRTTEVAISGAGKADVVATEKLRAAISGAGKVSYGGNPKTVEKRVAGAGSIRPKD